MLSAEGAEGATLLHIGAASDHPDVIRALLNAGVDASVVPKAGKYADKTPYQVASPSVVQAFHVYLFEKIALGQENVISNLLDSGIPVDLRDSSSLDDCTLHWACSFGNLSVVELLLSRGCAVNKENNSKQTPFHLACKNASREVMDSLLSHGANALHKDSIGRLASDLLPEKNKDLSKVIDTHIAEHPDQHHAENSSSRAESVPSPKLHSFGDIETSYPERNLEVDGPSRSCRARSIAPDVNSHLILWPPPQRQRMLPTVADEGPLANDIPQEAPDGGIVFSSVRPVLISCTTDASSSPDVNCFVELCGLTHAFRRFGLECAVMRSPASADIRFSVNTSLCPGHHRYSINVCPSFISVIASDREGLLYGAYTLVQIAQLHSDFGAIEKESDNLDESRDEMDFDINGFGASGAKKPAEVIRTLTIPCVSIEDWPDFPSRGITWSYDAAALTDMTVLENNIALLSKLRINKLLLKVDCLDHSGNCPEMSESELSARQRENILSGTRIYYIERLCKRFMIDVVPVVRVPCFSSTLGVYERYCT